MLAQAVLSAFPRFLFFLFLFFFLETSSSAGRWAMGFGKELRKQLRKWLMAADNPDSSTPCRDTRASQGRYLPSSYRHCSASEPHTNPVLTGSGKPHRKERRKHLQMELAESSTDVAQKHMSAHTHRYIVLFQAATQDRETRKHKEDSDAGLKPGASLCSVQTALGMHCCSCNQQSFLEGQKQPSLRGKGITRKTSCDFTFKSLPPILTHEDGKHE